MKTFCRRSILIMTLLLCIVMLPLAVCAEDQQADLMATVEHSGTTGSLSWQLDSDGLLTISGTGEMNNFNKITSGTRPTTAPWGSYKSAVKQVIMSEGITSVGKYAFYGMEYITDITIPDTVTSIGDYAFFGCADLESVSIPKDVSSIGYYAFVNCGSVTSYEVNSENAYYTSENGVLFNKEMTELIHYPVANSAMSYTVPAGVETIGPNAFSYAASLTSVTLNSSVKYIGVEAFKQCYELTSVTGGTNIVSYGDHAFYYCNKLSGITIPSTATSIGAYAFTDCDALATIEIPDSVTSIGEDAFDACAGLTSVVLSSAITVIPDHAFYNCKNLGSIVIPADVTSIGVGAFSGCKALTSVTIPDKVTSLGTGAFSYCTSLKSITIPESVTTLGTGGAFAQCGFSPKTAGPIGSGCEMEFGWSEVIPEYGFAYCNSLHDVTIPEGVTTIGMRAFIGCALDSIIIPDTVTEIGEDALNSNVLISDLYYYGSEDDWACITGHESVHPTRMHYNYNSYDGGSCGAEGDDLTWTLSRSGELAISGTGDMASFTSEGAPWHDDEEMIKTIVIGDGVTGIGSYAFYGCGNINKITFKGDAPAIGENAFADVSIDAYYYCDAEGWDAVTGNYGSWTWHVKHGDVAAFSGYEANCVVNGCEDYWKCRNCGKFFSDEACANEIEEGSWVIPASHDLTSHEAKAATCTEAGWDAYDTCNKCDYTTYVEIPATGHAFGEWTTVTSPDCTNTGSEQRICSVCKYTETRDVAENGHAWESDHTVDKAPTCTEEGSESIHCSKCNAVMDSRVIPALGHDVISHDAKAVTCTEAGWDAYDTCSRCDYTTYVEIPALGHDLEKIEANDASCTEAGFTDGNIAYWRCRRCGKCFSDEEGTNELEEDKLVIPASHDLIPHDAKAPTCTEPGWDAYYTCSRCNYTTYVEIPALGHKESDYIVEKKAGFTANGSMYKECTVCGERLETKTIYKASATLSKASDSIYNGYTAKVTVRNASDYSVTGLSRNVGKHTAKITLKDNRYYNSTKSISYTIRPKGTTQYTPKAAKKAFTARWKKQSTNMAASKITGYEIQYATNSKFTTGKKSVKVKGYSTTSKKISKLKAKKKYYVRVRTYKTVSGVNYYSNWSSYKTVTTK